MAALEGGIGRLIKTDSHGGEPVLEWNRFSEKEWGKCSFAGKDARRLVGHQAADVCRRRRTP